MQSNWRSSAPDSPALGALQTSWVFGGKAKVYLRHMQRFSTGTSL